MKLRTRLDVFSAALLSALGASQVIACGGSALGGGPSGEAGSPGSAGSGTAGAASAGADAGGNSGAGTAGSGTAGSGTAGAAHAGASSGGGTGDGNHFPCKNPKELGGGLIQCDGFTHRTTSGTCDSKIPRPDPYPNPSPSAQCKLDSDCAAQPYGWCGSASYGDLPPPYCNYGCVKDSDCGTNQLCECGDPVGRCVQAGCVSDADCDAGFLCKGYDASGGCGITTYTCQSLSDTCGNDADCAGNSAGSLCRFDITTKHFKCEFGGCAIGRPFLVEGEARLAPPASRADWRELALLPRLEGLDAALRAELASEWTRIALMEHASIAAFARFSMQLMSLGAPAELVELTTSAMLDETKHAKACFAVASRYAPSPIGPGPLAIESSLTGTSLEEIVLNTIREGCVGETVAAIEAREAAEHAQDPALKQLLETISEDETKHAELAFRFVQWALSIGGAALETAVRHEFQALAALAQKESKAVDATSNNQLLVHGVVPPELRRTIRAQAFTDVILPCAQALQTPADSKSQSEASTLSSAS
jgi:hypothetical protein